MRKAHSNCNRATGRGEGFSLIELLIVVAIILIIAAIAIPNMVRAKMAANEANAVQVCRTLVTASIVYAATYSNGYPPTIQTLGGPGSPATCDAAALIDQTLAAPPNQKSGYTFTYTMQSANPSPAPSCGSPGGGGFTVTALPNSVGSTGQRSFFVDQTGVIRGNPTGGAPTATDPPI